MFTVAILAQGTILGANATRRPFLYFAVRVLSWVVVLCFVVWVVGVWEKISGCPDLGTRVGFGNFSFPGGVWVCGFWFGFWGG